jgi:hypothetical protein
VDSIISRFHVYMISLLDMTIDKATSKTTRFPRTSRLHARSAG